MSGEDVERVLESAELFGRPLSRRAVAALLERGDHHLLFAYLDGEAVGFALAHELPRLDGVRPKLLLYEIGVVLGHRRQGVGSSLIEGMKELGRRQGARCLFTITEEGNGPAMALYSATGALRRSSDECVLEYPL